MLRAAIAVERVSMLRWVVGADPEPPEQEARGPPCDGFEGIDPPCPEHCFGKAVRRVSGTSLQTRTPALLVREQQSRSVNIVHSSESIWGETDKCRCARSFETTCSVMMRAIGRSRACWQRAHAREGIHAEGRATHE